MQVAILSQVGALPTAQLLALLTPRAAGRLAEEAARLMEDGDGDPPAAGSLMQWSSAPESLLREAQLAPERVGRWASAAALSAVGAICTGAEQMGQLRKVLLRIKG